MRARTTIPAYCVGNPAHKERAHRKLCAPKEGAGFRKPKPGMG